MPVPEHQSRVRDSYDAVTDAYVERVHDELVHKPLDRALLTAFAEQLQERVRHRARPSAMPAAVPATSARSSPAWGSTVTGIDLSPAMVARAQGAAPGSVLRGRQR